MKLVGNHSVFSYLGSVHGAVTITITVFVVAAIITIANILNINFFGVLHIFLNNTVSVVKKLIGHSEARYRRDIAIGKIDNKCKKVKIYRFLNDLTIDLGLKQVGASPYEFLFICLVASFLITFIVSELLFEYIWMIIIMYPIIFAAFMCICYTKANIAHDSRIEAVIEAENIICNNIKAGVVVSVQNSINLMPYQIKPAFEDFLDNIDHKNYHVRTALMELNQHLGSTADDFIKKCIVFETEEEHGIVGMFSDLVKINNNKMETRIEMKHNFERITNDFIIGTSMIFVFLGGVIGIYSNVADFYFHTLLGQIILALDLLVVITEFVYITYLRAKDF